MGVSLRRLLVAVLVVAAGMGCRGQRPAPSAPGVMLASRGVPISAAQEFDLGKRLATMLRTELGEPYPDYLLQQYIDGVGKRVADVTAVRGDLPGSTYQFTLLDSERVGVYGCPGGFVFLTVGMLRLLTDETMLAALLAHEVAHVDEAHLLRGMQESDGGEMLGTYVATGDAALRERLATQFLTRARRAFFEAGYARYDEYRADRIAADAAVTVHYNPRGMTKFLERVSRRSGREPEMADYTVLHPNVDARWEQLDRHIRLAGLSSRDWTNEEERFAEFTGRLR